jgi:D-alanine transaminase
MAIVYLNGRFVPESSAAISPLDRGFLFGDAIYEVVRFDRGRPYRLGEHLQRMRDGLAAIRLDVSPDFFAAASERLLAENGLSEKDAFVYAQVSRGAAPRYHAFPPPGTTPTVFAFARETDPPPPDGGKAILLTDERWGRCDIKSVNLLPNVLSAQRARDAQAMDAILIRDGFALEGTKANLFIVVKGGVLRTAPNGPRILPGVTRHATIEAARRLGLTVEERAFTVEEMFAAQEVFFASTTLWTYPLVSIEGRTIGTGKPGPVVRMLREALLAEFRGVPAA